MASAEFANDSTVKTTEKPDAVPESLRAASLAPDSHTIGLGGDKMMAASDTTSHVLPGLSIDGAKASDSNHHWWSGAAAVAGDLATGAYDQVTEHPLQLLSSAAVGVAMGAGLALASPEIAIGIGVAGAAVAGYELYEHGGDWLHDAKVVANSSDYTAGQVNQAHTGLQDVGAGAAIMVAGMAGGALGAYATDYVAAATATGGTSFAPYTPQSSEPIEWTPPAAKASLAALNRPDAPFQPFSVGDTTFTQSPESTWEQTVAADGNDPNKAAILGFANRWATQMERNMEQGQPTYFAVEEKSAYGGDDAHVSQSVINQAGRLLAKDWAHGSTLSGRLFDTQMTWH